MRKPIPIPRDQWRRWFAWHSVEIAAEFVWWEWVERRWNAEGGYLHVIDAYDPGEMSGAWEYRDEIA